MYGVLGILLTIVPSTSTLHKRIRILRNCVLINIDFYDLSEFTHLRDKEGIHNYMLQLATQAGLIRETLCDGTRHNCDITRHIIVEQDSPTIATRLAHGPCLEIMTDVGDGTPESLERTTIGLCCSGDFVAWREPPGLVVMDARSGKICRKISNRAPDECHLRGRNSVLAFASMDAGDNRLLISANCYSNNIRIYDWTTRVQTPDFSEGELVNTLRDHDRPVTTIAVSGNNSLLVSGSKDCRIIHPGESKVF